VTDTGVGIAKQKLGTIFDQFSQADGTTSRRYGGTGLGLSISRDIARLLGGEIRASSKLGKGSTFTLYLPTGYAPGAARDPSADAPEVLALPDGAVVAAVAAAEAPGAAGAPGVAGDGDDAMNGARILIVDDDARSVFALTGVFERYGAEVLYAENGRAGIESLERNADISLVLMDVMMPEMDGFTAMREIRKRPELKKLPIIALTAKAMPDDLEACLADGANDYIAKPLDVEKLLSLIRVWMPK
jgi:CheY-like chemotaxis protein